MALSPIQYRTATPESLEVQQTSQQLQQPQLSAEQLQMMQDQIAYASGLVDGIMGDMTMDVQLQQVVTLSRFPDYGAMQVYYANALNQTLAANDDVSALAA